MRFAKPFDMTKFRKEQNKKLKIKDGFHDPITWVSTGNYALNKMMSGNFNNGIPIGSVTTFAGESGCLPASAKVAMKLYTTEKRVFEFTTNIKCLRILYFDMKNRKQEDFGWESIEIDTPDGFQKIISWWDKGSLPMISIRTENGTETKCAENHLLQLDNNEWVPASLLRNGLHLITKTGISEIISITKEKDEECYDFEIDHPNHRYWGDGFSSHNSGKSYIVSGNIVKNALDMGIAVVLLDTEGAIKKTWASALGVDTNNEMLIRWNKRTISQVAETIADFMDDYVNTYISTPREEQPPVLFVIDSLGNLETETGIKQFNEGDLKGDRGLFPRQLKAFMKNTIGSFDNFQCGGCFTNHIYKSQDMYAPDDIITGGSGPVYLSDIVVSMNKYKLKEDANGNKVTTVQGIRSKVKCVKSRYAKPFEEVEVLIPYDRGMDPYSGLFDMFENKVLKKDGNKWLYYSKETGEEFKLFKKEMKPEFFDMIMREWEDDDVKPGVDEISTLVDETE